jgi:DNA mismatch repair protein MutL
MPVLHVDGKHGGQDGSAPAAAAADEVADRPARRVRVLPPEVANQIAAGEVVERPASVVKELVENALDAGAHRIAVDLEGAGTDLIAVVDDGEGMSIEDAVCAFSRHATSKIHLAEDLQRIGTMGFRGEALASIAAVSRTTLVTRRRDDLSGARVEVHWGCISDAKAAGAPPGTRVEVAELFGNTPARRKFLRAPSTEVGHVSELISRAALAWPEVGFTLRHGGRTLIELAPVEDHAERVRQVLGPERWRSMLPFAGRAAAGWIAGWISATQLTFPTPRQIFTYVNRRHVRDKLVHHALLAGYSTLLMHGRYPAAVVFMDLPPEDVDVNVHPSKAEVRFRRGGAVHELIGEAVRNGLREIHHSREPTPAVQPLSGQTNLWAQVPPLRPAPPLRLVDDVAPPPVRDAAHLPLEPWRDGGSLPPEQVDVTGLLPNRSPQAATERTEETARSEPSVAPTSPLGFFSALRVIGQVFSGYLVCEDDDRLVLIDQHAAHERVTFERLRGAYGTGGMARQQLLVPEVVELGPREAALVAERIDELAALGFDVEPFGGASFALRSMPALLGDCNPAAVLRDVAEELVEVGRSRKIHEAADAVLAKLACHSAVRVGQSLGAGQIRALLQSMDRVDFSGNCPHGRPAYLTISRSDLERWFKRT